MELLYADVIHGGRAELFKAENNDIVMKYNGVEIDRSGGETYLNMHTDAACCMYARLCVLDYERAGEREKEAWEFRNFVKELGWETADTF